MSDSAVTATKYTEKTYNKINFQSIKIGLASPEAIKEWSYGEVTKPETINYRTLKPEADGLYCEKIFGPVKDWECNCGRYKRSRFKGHICEKCGVKVTKSKVRRERMGHIELASPVAHIWYSKGTPSKMAQVLDIPVKSLEAVLYFNKYVVINPGSTGAAYQEVITEAEYARIKENYYDDEEFEAGMGAAAVKKLLQAIDLDELAHELRQDLETAKEASRKKLLQRLRVVESFRQSGNRPEWMILDVVPVLPPDIRPMVQLEGGRFATSDLNDLYRRVLNRNNRLKEMMKQGAPSLVVKNELRMLQEAVDSLIDNGKRGAPIQGANSSKRPLKSLSDMLRGKQGRFRQNLLGKRVDYSGRSVIVVGPELKMYQCGLPKEMALELFKPFVMRKMVELDYAPNHRAAKKDIENNNPRIWDALEIVIKDHPVMLNRAPTLHRLGIQAFEPILVEGRAIKLHPLVCTAFNADFDGDQMAVHVPLSVEAQTEARVLMLAANNLLKPADGKPVTVPTQDMVLGSYYLTMVREDEKGTGHVYRDEAEAVMAYDAKELQIHAPIVVRMSKKIDGVTYSALVPTTLGQIIFNKPVPQDLGFVKRDPSDPVSMLRPEIGIEAVIESVDGETKIRILNDQKKYIVGKGLLGKIIDRVIAVHGVSIASEVLDNVKNQGYKYSTRSGTTVSVFDAWIPASKGAIVDETQANVDRITNLYNRGRITDGERREAVIELWKVCTKKVSDELTGHLDNHNPIHMMIDSGARGSTSQLNQLAGMRGTIANTAGQTIEVPIKANYREGLSVREYFIASRGARKGLADTALRTADSGYLTRRLVDVSQEIIVREVDCGCSAGFEVSEIYGDERVLETLQERLIGRYLLHDLITEDGEVIMTNDRMMTAADADRIAEAGFKSVVIRSLLTCESRDGVCVKCYGKDLATGRPVSIGEAVGIIAAQSIGEPGTQLTMRTFHTGGVTTSGSDITQGLPRVEELFEARRPTTYGTLTEIDGTCHFGTSKKGGEIITVVGDEGAREYPISYGFVKKVEDGQFVTKGTALTSGAIWPQDILRILGVDAVRNYLISQVQNTYRTQGVAVNDKHIEVIIHQMMRKSVVIDPGTTDLLPGQDVERTELNNANEAAEKRAIEEGGVFVAATTEPTILGVTKAALATESFLSAASFQETTKVLTEAAIRGKTDRLVGLKENVIIGKLLPSGTGMKCYSDVSIESNSAEDILNTHAKVVED